MTKPTILQLPQSYDRASIQRVIQDLADKIPDIPAPKELPTQPVPFEIPPAEEAILLNINQSTTADRWHTKTIGSRTYSGPGRIWTATARNAPIERKKAVRYRIPTLGTRMGVMSCRFVDPFTNNFLDDVAQGGSSWDISYGIIIKDIPWYGTKLPEIFSAFFYTNQPPGAVAASKGVGTAATKLYLAIDQGYFEPHVNNDYENDSGRPIMYTPFSDTALTVSGHNWLRPDDDGGDYTKIIKGVSAMLITGTTANDVFAEVNSLVSTNFNNLQGESPGPSISAPNNIDTFPPTGVVCMTVEPTPDVDLKSKKIQNINLETNSKAVEGVPFTRADCGGMIRTMDSFSMVLRLEIPRNLRWNKAALMLQDPSEDQHPATWHTSGVELVRGNLRETLLDVVIA